MLGQGRKIIVSGSRDARVAAIAAQQRGRVARRQLLQGGLSPGQIHHLVRSDRLFVQLNGVYAVGSPAPVALGRETTALLAVRDGALLSHDTAARLWSRGGAWDGEDPVHVIVDDGWIPRVRGVAGHHSRILTAEDRRLRDRLPVCSPARTLLDLAPQLDQRALGRLLDEWRFQEIVRAGEITELLTRAGGHAGAAPLRALLADAEVDAGVTEVRDARLAAVGVEVLRITWRQMKREPLAVIARIASAVTRRTPTQP